MSQPLCSMSTYDQLNGSSVDVFLWDGMYGFSTVEVGAILLNEHGIQVQNYVALLQGSEITAGFHYRNWIFGI